MSTAVIGKITVPTLVLVGARDAIYPAPADKQAGLLTGVSDRTAVTIPDTGHALTFHRSQDQFQAQVSRWLTDRQLGGWAMPVGSADTGGGSAATASHPVLTGLGVLLLTLAGGVLFLGRRRSSLRR